MAKCQTCPEIVDCLTFDITAYNLSKGREYSNASEIVPVNCPGVASPVPYTVAAGLVSTIFPFPADLDSYPPFVLTCAQGNPIVITIPDLSTQSQIDTLINAAIETCVARIAAANACVPVIYTNNTVLFPISCPSGPPQQIITFTGTLPSWISIDTVNGNVVGAQGTFQGASTDDATLTAQTNLNTFCNTQIGLGTLFCSPPPFYFVQGLPVSGNIWFVNNNTGVALNGQDFHLWHDNGGGLIPWLDGSGVGNVPAHSTTTVLSGGWAESKPQAFIVGGTLGPGGGVGGAIYGIDSSSAAAKTDRHYFVTIN